MAARVTGDEGDRCQVTLCLSFVSLLNLKRAQVHLSFFIPAVLSLQKKFQESDFGPSCAPAHTCL